MTVLLFTIQNWASRAQTAIFLKMAPVRLLGISQTLKIALRASCALQLSHHCVSILITEFAILRSLPTGVV